MKRMKTGITTALLAALVLPACNEGGFVPKTGAAATSTAEGVYGGTLTNSPSGATAFETIVLDDGTFWTLYGSASGTEFDVQGFARGTVTSSAGSFTSQQATDFGSTPPVSGTLTGTYETEAGTIQGSYTTASGTTGFSGGPIANSSYDYKAAPDAALLTGNWSVQDTDGITYTLDVAADGTFSVTEDGGGCTGTGAFSPHASGKNLFDVTMQFDNLGECVDDGGTASGIALAYPVTGTDTVQLIAAVNDQDTFGSAIFGTHPAP